MIISRLPALHTAATTYNGSNLVSGQRFAHQGHQYRMRLPGGRLAELVDTAKSEGVLSFTSTELRKSSFPEVRSGDLVLFTPEQNPCWYLVDRQSAIRIWPRTPSPRSRILPAARLVPNAICYVQSQALQAVLRWLAFDEDRYGHRQWLEYWMPDFCDSLRRTNDIKRASEIISSKSSTALALTTGVGLKPADMNLFSEGMQEIQDR